MLANPAQSEKEETQTTPEVSNPKGDTSVEKETMLCKDETNVGKVRRRKFAQSEENLEHTKNNSTTESSISETSSKTMRYPKISASYPKIVGNTKHESSTIPRSRKIDTKLLKPPSSKPPIFLKCKPKPKRSSSEDTDEEIEPISQDVESITTDLDIQFQNMNFESIAPASISPFDNPRKNQQIKNNPKDSQSFQQYCDFDEKKIVRIAPHIRRKDVICDTVDAWSIVHDEKSNAETSHYKPLIFGGSFPIDAPYGSETSTESIIKRNNVIIQKHISKTFDIDCPIDNE